MRARRRGGRRRGGNGRSPVRQNGLRQRCCGKGRRLCCVGQFWRAGARSGPQRMNGRLFRRSGQRLDSARGCFGADHFHSARVERFDPYRAGGGLDNRYRATRMVRQADHTQSYRYQTPDPGGDDGHAAHVGIHAGGRFGPIRRPAEILGDVWRVDHDNPYRISSTGSTPRTASPDRMTAAVADTSASLASVSAGRSACRKRNAASSLPRFHSI